MAEKDVPIWIVEGHGVDDVGVLFKGKEFFARVGVPNFAGAIITARNEAIARFVEGAVCQR